MVQVITPEQKKVEVKFHTVSTGGWNTSTFGQKMEDETNLVRGRGMAKYNPDVQIPQSPALKTETQNIESSDFREILFEESSFLRTHTYDQLWEIVRKGWKYFPKGFKKDLDSWRSHRQQTPEIPSPIDTTEEIAKIEDWSTELKIAFVEATSLAFCVDTAYLARYNADPANPMPIYQWYSRNDEYRPFVNRNRQIAEVYFYLPQLTDVYYQDPFVQVPRQIAGFLTQHDPLAKHPPSLFGIPALPKNQNYLGFDAQGNVTRNAVIIQPRKDRRDIHGIPYLKRELQTALEKLYLRCAEFAIIKKGGVDTMLAIAADMDDDIKDNLVKSVDRGIFTKGGILEVDGERDPNTVIMVKQTPIPDLHFETVNSHLSEDAQYSKQEVEGAAQTGALGGQAPVVNAQQDNTALMNLYPVVELIIKDINFVFFGVKQDSYEIYFTNYSDQAIIPSSDSNDDRDQNPTDETDTEEHGFAMPEIEICYHAIGDQYVHFTGHMLPAGVYQYPESTDPDKRFVEYTSAEIERMCKRSVRTGYLELDHAFNHELVATKEGIGYFTIKGYDPQTRADDTDFFIRKDVHEQILESRKDLKVSPRFAFSRRSDGTKDIFIENCAVLTKTRDRASLTGLDASAHQKK